MTEAEVQSADQPGGAWQATAPQGGCRDPNLSTSLNLHVLKNMFFFILLVGLKGSLSLDIFCAFQGPKKGNGRQLSHKETQRDW